MAHALKLKTLLLALMLILAACKSEPQTPMRIGTNVWIGYEPIYLGQSLGYFGTGLVTPVEFQSTTEEMSAFQAKAIDAAALTLDEAITLAQFDSAFSIVLVVDISHGGDAILGRPGIKSMKDLRGKRVGLETTAVCAYTLARALQKSGLKSGEISIVHMAQNEYESALKRGNIDAVVTFEPWRTKLHASGARLLFDSSQIPNEILDVIVVRKEYLTKHKDVVARFLDGWFRVLTYMKEHPQDAAEQMKGRLKFSSDEVIASYKGLRLPERSEVIGLLSGEHQPLLNTAKNIQTLMLEQRLLIKKTDVSLLVDRDMVNKLYGK